MTVVRLRRTLVSRSSLPSNLSRSRLPLDAPQVRSCLYSSDDKRRPNRSSLHDSNDTTRRSQSKYVWNVGSKQLASAVPGREQSSVSKASNTNSEQLNDPDTTSSHLSDLIIDHLFPARKGTSTQKGERIVPRLPVKIRHVQQEYNLPAASLKTSFRRGDQNRHETDKSNLTVLVLRNASPRLVEDDFKQLIPRGEHIEGWHHDHGAYEAVIPGRDTALLERKQHYYIIFSSPAAARAYQEHVTHLYKLAATYTPTSIEAPISPPGRSKITGKELNELRQRFALVAPTQNLVLDAFHAPFPSGMAQIINERGYRPLVPRPPDASSQVVVRIDGPLVTSDMIRGLVFRDGKSRGVPWSTMTSGMDHGVRLVSPKTPDPESSAPDSGDNGERVEESMNEFSRWNRNPARAKAHDRFWIISFTDPRDATRFANAWDHRPFPSDLWEKYSDDTPPVLLVEALWN